MNATRALGRLRTFLALTRLLLLFAIALILATELGLLLRSRPPGLLFSSFWQRSPGAFQASSQPRLGVNVALEQYDEVGRRQALARLRRTGFTWVRQRLDWGRLEPQPGRFRWEESDALIRAIQASGLEPVVVLDGSPAWARAPQDRPPWDNPFAPPQDPTDFARFARAFARRYRDQVRFYQIWDEPNIAPHWGNQLIDPVGYARLLQEASQAIQAVDPDATILLAALAPTGDRGHTAMDEPYFLARLYAAGARDAFHILALEPFGFGQRPTDPRQRVDVLNFRRAALVRPIMAAAGDGDKPVWAVRFGWNRQANRIWRAVTPAQQQTFLQEAVALAQREWPWMQAMAWAIDRPGPPPPDPLWGFALVTPEDEPTPLLGTFARLAHEPPSPASTPEPAFPWRTLFLVGGLILAAWRGLAAARRVSWAQGFAWYRGLALPWRMAAWALLLAIYHLATWPPLILACWILAALLLAAQPLTGLLLAGLLLPFQIFHKELRLVDGVWAVPPVQALTLALLPSLLRETIRRWRARSWTPASLWTRFHPLDRLALGWLLLNLASGVNVWHWPGYVQGLTSLALTPLLLYLAARFHLTRDRALAWTGLALMAGGGLAAAMGLADWLGGGGVLADGMRRLAGVTFSPNQLALTLERALFLALAVAWLGLSCPPRPWERWLGGAVALVTGMALFLTGSRGALFLGAPAGMGLLLGLAWAGRRPTPGRWTLQGAGLLGMVGLLTLGTALWTLGERLANWESVWQRLYIWQGSLALWERFPLLGVGPGGFFWRYPAVMVPAAAREPNLLHPHNLWLEMAVLWGLAGLIWLGFLGAALWREGRRLWARGLDRGGRLAWLAPGILAGMAAGLAHSQVDAFLALPELSGWLWLALGLLASWEGGRR